MVSIPTAIFFRRATTFSFPGMTMYSVSKFFSTSTSPSASVGRSFYVAAEGSLQPGGSPLPRYFGWSSPSQATL